MALLPAMGHFDAEPFGGPPRRAGSLDPRHRLLIDSAREAVQDAAQEAGVTAGERVGDSGTLLGGRPRVHGIEGGGSRRPDLGGIR
ncbi:beta-ketoacyl synthase N-terminal-like domain-containing protein [Streptomyces californicus]|uniref:beta-ketoacyl synthase N-terminal-like domain-containing protein n=1 Tax=Streptomyces californicus TaxID=67351 RepID=UPI00378AB6B4